MFELSFTFASSSSSSSSFHVRFTRISYRQTLAAGVTCEFLCSRVPGTPVWRLITRERAAAAEALARSGPTRARGTRVVASRARAVMGKGLDLDAWIAKVRARPCADVRLRVDAASKRPLRASFSSTRPDLRRSRRGSANAPLGARTRGRASATRLSALSRNARTSLVNASRSPLRVLRASFVACFH